MPVLTVDVGGGVAEVTAILLAAYFAKNSLFPRVKHTQNAHTHEPSSFHFSTAAAAEATVGKRGE